MAYDIGINFRATAGYVTDGSGETYSLGETYPTTRGGVTFGWVTNAPDTTRDRDSALDRRLAGMNARNGSGSGTNFTFRIDLPETGNATIDLAYGDGNAGTDADAANITFKDNATALGTVTANPTSGKMADASGNLWTYAAWPGSKVPLSVTFASTTFLLVLGDTPTHFSPLAHVRVTSAGGAAGHPAMRRLGLAAFCRPAEIGREGVGVM